MNRDRSIDQIALSASGKRLISIGDGFVRVWDASKGSLLATITTTINGNAFYGLSRDGQKIGLASNDGSLGIYSTQFGARLVNIAGKSVDVGDAGFSPDGRHVIVASETNGIVSEWDITSNTSRILIKTLGGDSKGANVGANIAFAPGDDAHFAVADESAMHVFDAHTGSDVRTFSLPPLAAKRYGGAGTLSALSPDGHTLLASSSDLHGLNRYDWKRSKRLPAFIGQGSARGYYINFSYAPDGKTFVSTSKALIRIHDARTGRAIRLISANYHTVGTVQFSRDGKSLVAGSNDGWIRVYDARSGQRTLAFAAHKNWIRDARFSPDGSLIASASKDQSVRIWNANDGTLVASLDTNGEAHAISFSSDGRRLLVGADDGVRIWDFMTNRTVVAFRGFTDGIVEAKFALHDTRIVTLGADNALRLWTVPELPICQKAIDEAHARMAHELTPALRNAEFITPRHSPTILNALLPRETCS